MFICDPTRRSVPGIAGANARLSRAMRRRLLKVAGDECVGSANIELCNGLAAGNVAGPFDEDMSGFGNGQERKGDTGGKILAAGDHAVAGVIDLDVDPISGEKRGDELADIGVVLKRSDPFDDKVVDFDSAGFLEVDAIGGT